MQDCFALRRETRDLPSAVCCEGVSLVPYDDRWNPVAAVIVHGLKLPDTVAPRTVDLRIPIPRLYGFSTVVVFSLTEMQLMDVGGRAPIRVPFCRPFLERDATKHGPYLPDFVNRSGWTDGMHLVCITPEWAAMARVRHIALSEYVSGLLTYLRDSVSLVKAELTGLMDMAEREPRPETLMRLGYLLFTIGDVDTAKRVCQVGLGLFPAYRGFAVELERLESTLPPSAGN
jgi:hypothetical protein